MINGIYDDYIYIWYISNKWYTTISEMIND